MTAVKMNWHMEQGATFARYITWKDPDGELIDLTGYRIRFQVRREYDSATTLVDFDSADLTAGMSLSEPLDASGVIGIVLAASVTTNLRFDSAVYDVIAISGDDTVYRLIEGRINCFPAVTR